MLNMIEAFSNARLYCEVGLCVKASNLGSGKLSDRPGSHNPPVTYQVKLIRMWFSSTGNLRSRSSSWP